MSNDVNGKQRLAMELLRDVGRPISGHELAERAGDAVKSNTLQVALFRLEARGLVQSQPGTAPGPSGRPRKLFELSRDGRVITCGFTKAPCWCGVHVSQVDVVPHD